MAERKGVEGAGKVAKQQSPNVEELRKFQSADLNAEGAGNFLGGKARPTYSAEAQSGTGQSQHARARPPSG